MPGRGASQSVRHSVSTSPNPSAQPQPQPQGRYGMDGWLVGGGWLWLAVIDLEDGEESVQGYL